MPKGETVMTKAVRVHKVGGPEALVYEDVDVPAPGPGEVRIRCRQVGVCGTNCLRIHSHACRYVVWSAGFSTSG